MATASVRSPLIEAFSKKQHFGSYSLQSPGFNAQSIPSSATSFSCLHCEFTCQSSADLSKHRWEEHPLLTRRKQHLMRSRKRPSSASSSSSSSSSSDSSGTDEPTPKKLAAPLAVASSTALSSPSLLRALVQTPTAFQQPQKQTAPTSSSAVNFHHVTSLATTTFSSSKHPQVSSTSSQQMKEPQPSLDINDGSMSDSDDVQIIAEKSTMPPRLAPKVPTLSPVLNSMTMAEMSFLARAGSLTYAPELSQLKSHLCRGRPQFQHQSPSAASPNLTSLVTQYNHTRQPKKQKPAAPTPIKPTTGMSLRDHLMASRACPVPVSSNVPSGSRSKPHSSVHSVASSSRPSYSKQTYQARFSAPRCDPPKRPAAVVEGANIKQLLQISNRLQTPPQTISPKSTIPAEPILSPSPISSRYSDSSSPLSTLSDVATQILQNDHFQQQAAASSPYIQDIEFRQQRPPSRSPSECSSSSLSSRCSTPPFSPRSRDRSFDLSKHTKEMLSAGKSLLHEERVKELVAAIKNVDCCDPNERSNILPYKSEDGTWKMVRVKRIGGAWLMQMPGKPQPVVFIPKLNSVSPLARPNPSNTASKDTPSGGLIRQIMASPPTMIGNDSESSTQSSSLIKSLLSQKSTLSKMLTV